MERKIVRHAVGAAAHEAALDAEFHVGQRVVTIDGVAGRIQFVTGSFSPGVAEYQVALDSGMGGGTYTASQLRAVPDSYRAPSGPHSNLPAGVTAGLEAEAGEIHLASEDYPEMGSILHDRPDPAGLIRMIGRRSEYEDREPHGDVPLRALRPTAGLSRTADAYAQGHDERDDDENGGSQDVGMYWEAPANQQWRDENLGEPPEPQIEDVPGYGQEEFEQGFGKVSTTINGQEIDGHGDAPQHGTQPRAGEPNVYDSASTEGQGDPDEDKPLSGMSEQAGKGATAGMFPSGVSAGDGFGMSFGAAFGQDQSQWDAWNDYAADKPADPHDDHDTDHEDELRYPEEHLRSEGRVPWTGEERTELHNWDNEAEASAGDFVPSGNFTGRHPVQPHEQIAEPAQEVIERSLQAQGASNGRLCAYEHHGECEWPGEEHLTSTAESMRHPRPRGYSSELHEIGDEERQRHLDKHGITPTHAIHGLLNGRHIGTLTFQQSEDNRAVYITNLHSNAQGKGVASAMMDDLYSHARQQGMWVNHGQRTRPGASWWNSYREPHPELNVHKAQPDEPMRESGQHPAGQPWKAYWSPHEVAGDMWVNTGKDKAGKHPEPHFDEYEHDDDPHYEQWKKSKIPLREPEARSAWADAKADVARDMHDDDPYHGWGDMAREHAHTGSLQAEAASDEFWADHLRHDHGYSDDSVARVRASGNRISDFHGAIHDAGLARHEHDPGLLHRQETGTSHLPAGVTERWPERSVPSRHQDQPGHGGQSPADPMVSIIQSEPRRAELPKRDLAAFWSSRQAEAGVRVRTNGPNDFTFHHVPDDSEDPDNSLEDGDPAEDNALDNEQDENGLENGEAPGQAPADEDTGKDGPLDSETDPDESGAVGNEPPGNLPAGVQPPAAPSGRPPSVPQAASMPAETWPLATAPVQERPLPLSQGGKPSPSTKRSNPVKLQLPGAGGGAEVDGEKPGAEDKGAAKEAALAAFTAAAGSQAFRFEFTAGWRDVVAKAKRLRKGGRVRIVHSSAGMVIGEVGGDHDVYECGIQRPAGKPQTIQHWACGCPWASFHQDSSYPGWLNGRPCSHVYALQLEASSRYSQSHGGDVYSDPSADELGVPHNVVVKSMPPWGAGGWAQTWLAPAASLGKTAEMFCPSCSGDRDDLGRCMDCGQVSRDLRQENYLPGAVNVPASKLAGRHERAEAPEWAEAPEDDTDWEYYEGGDEPSPWGEGRHRRPAHAAALVLVAAGEPAEDVELLARTAGIDLTAAANDAWGDNNYAEHPPAKPYGATSPRDPSQNPANTGPLNGPDPADWAEIPDSSLTGPITSESSLPGLDQPAQAVPDSPGGAMPYAYRAGTAGPATPADPGDPNGLSVDAAMGDEGAEYERHLIEQHGVPADWASRHDHEKHLRDHDEINQMHHHGEPLPEGYQPHPYHQTPWEYRQEPASWPDAGHSHSFTASEERALPDPTPTAGEHHHRECTCPTCEYDRYHAKHAVQLAMTAGMAELEAAAGEQARQRAGIDGTAGDAQDVPHEFSGNTPYCHACGLSAESDVHRRNGAQGEFHSTPEPALPETTADLAAPDATPAGQYALDPGATGGGPGMSGGDESLSPSDTSIQTIGEANSGGSDELADESFSVSPQENQAEAYADDPVSQFQATAAARLYGEGGGQAGGDGEVAAAAKAYLAKTADVLPDHEAAALISEGRGGRARNLDLLQLEGTHYEGVDDEMGKRGLNLDDYDDDLVVL